MSIRGRHSGRFGDAARPAILIALAGMALGVATDAAAVSRLRTIYRLNSLVPPSQNPGSTVVIGNIEGGHVWPTHEALEGRVTRVWWNANEGNINGSLRGMFFSAHATAAASAMAAEEWVFPPHPGDLFNFPNNVQGFAPNAPLILSAGFATGRNVFGVLTGVTDTSVAFAIFALTDQRVADFAAAHLGIDEYPVASVVNASFGSVSNDDDRRGESLDAHAFDAAAWHTDATIVVAAGDFQNDPQLEEDMMMPGDPGGSISSPGTAFNVLTIGALNQNLSSETEDTGEGPVGVVDWRKGANTMNMIDPAFFFPPCMAPSTLTTELASMRVAVHLLAPGTLLTLAGDPVLDPPDDFSQEDSDNAWSKFWSGTSFASAIAAGTAALVHDLGNKNGLWLEDSEGVSRPSGLVTRAIMINAADQSSPTPTVMNSNQMGAEADACVIMQPLDDLRGAGSINPVEIRKQLFAPNARDIRSDPAHFPYVVDGIPRTLTGMERSNYAPTLSDPTDLFREAPRAQWTNGEIAALAQDGPPKQDWFGPWGDVVEVTGTDPDRPFITTLSPVNEQGGLLIAPPVENEFENPTPLDVIEEDDAAPANAPAPKVKRASQYRELGQPGIEFPDDPVLDNGGRGGIFPPGPGMVPGPGTGGGGNGGFDDIGSPGVQYIAGWDHGRLGPGFIDYPIGFLTSESDMRATLVWNRTEIWREDAINSWASTFGFQELDSGRVEPVAKDANPGTFPGPNFSEDGFLVPTFQRAFAMENLDLEIWRRNLNGTHSLVGASRSMWGTVEHLSIGDGEQSLCLPPGGVKTGVHFIRVKFQETLFDFGGYRYCQDFQSLQLQHELSNVEYENLYPGEVEFAVAWSATVPGVFNSMLNAIRAGDVQPVDMDGNGSINDDDVMLMVRSAAGDANLDGVINAADLAIVLSAYGTNDARYDLNEDGVVNGADIAHLLSKFGEIPFL